MDKKQQPQKPGAAQPGKQPQKPNPASTTKNPSHKK